MSKNQLPMSAAQIERRQAAQAKRQRPEKLWTTLMLVVLVTVFVLIVAIQVSHHL